MILAGVGCQLLFYGSVGVVSEEQTLLRVPKNPCRRKTHATHQLDSRAHSSCPTEIFGPRILMTWTLVGARWES